MLKFLNRNKLNLIYLFLLYIIFILFLKDFYDYDSYKELYYNTNSYLAAYGRDPGFNLINSTFSKFFDYHKFRIILTLYFFIIIFSLLKNINFYYNVKLIDLIAITPFILLKFGFQIREGIALSIWLYFAIKPRIDNMLIIFFGIISVSIHLSVLPLWSCLFLLNMRIFNRKIIFLIIFLLYSIYGSFLLNPSLLNIGNINYSEFIRSDFIYSSGSPAKYVYYICILMISVYVANACLSRFSCICMIKNGIHRIGFIASAAMLGLCCSSILVFSFFGISSIDISFLGNILRQLSLFITLSIFIFIGVRCNRFFYLMIIFFIWADFLRSTLYVE